MSCLNGVECREAAKRHMALLVLGLMAIIFLVLSAWSFLPSRTQAVPDAISFADQSAVDGKRVFQAYNCMGCHTIVGNGAYFGPDLTRIYADAGPAWLAAFLPSAGGWPTQAAVQVQLQNEAVQKAAGTSDIQEYRKKFPGAAERMDLRGGHKSLMPNLPFDANETKALIAFLEYTSAMHTEGWPPKPNDDRKIPAKYLPATAAAPTALASSPAAVAGPAAATEQTQDPVAMGKKLVADMGCLACHATDDKRTVGPGWGGLFDTDVKLADGSVVKADEAYLIESIRNPGAQVVDGYPAVMPPYDESMINESDMQAIVAYLRSL